MWNRWGWDRGWEKKPPRRPAKGGLKAASQRGDFAEKWWGKRWVSVIESFNLGARLTRGRSYARGGHVRSIDVNPGRVLAKVQGSRSTPYTIQIELAVLSSADWDRVIEVMGRQAVFAAKLLAGEMPRDIESVFTDLGLSLFPKRSADLKTNCSCPDWSNPCKHVAAVFYLLGEHFDRDPFLIFSLRGLAREPLFERLEAVGDDLAAAPEAEPAPPPGEPLTADLASFWDSPVGSRDESPLPVVFTRESAATVRLLGPFPFWSGEESFLDTVAAIQAAASAKALEIVLGPDREPAE